MAEVPPRFVELVSSVTSRIANEPLNSELADKLNAIFPNESGLLRELESLCRLGCEQGWLCSRVQGSIRFGRVIKAGTETHGFSVDVVEMTDVEGPHHSHPNGEIDLVMPIDEGASFDGVAKGWKVYSPGSAHRPTVTGGKAIILYLLPEGAIEFTRD